MVDESAQLIPPPSYHGQAVVRRETNKLAYRTGFRLLPAVYKLVCLSIWCIGCVRCIVGNQSLVTRAGRKVLLWREKFVSQVTTTDLGLKQRYSVSVHIRC